MQRHHRVRRRVRSVPVLDLTLATPALLGVVVLDVVHPLRVVLIPGVNGASGEFLQGAVVCQNS